MHQKQGLEELQGPVFYANADKLHLAVDCIIFGFDENTLQLLLFKRKVEPFKDDWSLIGSFVNEKESVRDAASRVLYESTGLESVYMELAGCYGAVDRDPGARVVSLSFYALLRVDEQNKEQMNQYNASWFEFNDLPELVLDHKEMVDEALDKLKRKARYRPIGFELLPEKFTLPQLRTLYEAIFREELDRRNFRKKILSMKILEKLEEKDKQHSRKGAYLYRFDRQKYEEKLIKGFNFEL